MINQILNILECHKKKRIKLIDIDNELRRRGVNVLSSKLLKIEFYNVITALTNDGILIPMKSSKSLQLYEGLFDKYVINGSHFKPENILSDDRFYVEMTNDLSSKINISYYLKHRDEYVKHRDYILKISKLLSMDDVVITANERAYELFGDEKALTSPGDAAVDGNLIIKNLGLNLEDIRAEKVFEPFVYLMTEDFTSFEKNYSRNVLIIENKDTYWTFKEAVMKGNLNDIQLVIYGEGKAILSKFEYIKEVGGVLADNYYYFGDIDSEGINIYNQFFERYPEYNIRPAVSYYEYILSKEGVENSKLLRTSQKIKSFSPFIDFFCHESRETIKKIILDRRYLPQEVINRKDMGRLKEIGL